jgi:DNA-binding transcriptional regulator YiaG
MSKLGKALIKAIKDSQKKGVIALTPSPDIVKLRKHLKLTQQRFANIYYTNSETLKK